MPKRTNRRTYAATPKRAAKHEVNQVIARLRNLGLKLEYAYGAGHYLVLHPDTGQFITTVSNTPSDKHFVHQVRRAVERAGFKWEARKRRRDPNPKQSGTGQIDREALRQAQRMAELYGERVPQADDLHGEQQKEADSMTATSVESARAHRVASRLLYLVEQKGEELAAQAKERRPLLRDGAVAHQIYYIASQIAAKRGMRTWKTEDSGLVTIQSILSGTSGGMSIWVANLLEATMDEIDGIHSEPINALPVNGNGASKTDNLSIAKNQILDVLTTEWVPRSALHDALVPGSMPEGRFTEAMQALIKENRVEREREKKYQGRYLLRLASAAGEKSASSTSKTQIATAASSKRVKSKLTTEQTEEAILALVGDEWVLRSELIDVMMSEGVTARTFDRAVMNLVQQGLIERERIAGSSRTHMRRIEEVADISQDVVADQEEQEASGAPRSLTEAIVGRSIADRYADALLKKLDETNGATDWAAMEPILARLDKLAGVAE